MPAAKPSIPAASFFEQLKAALSHYADPQWLGEHSPLAAPYFLGAALQQATPTPTGRGQALRQAIEQTLESLWGGLLPADGPAMLQAVADEERSYGRGGRYDCLILELNYAKRRFRPAPPNQATIYNDILHISRPTHDRHLHDAVERLGVHLLQRLRPAIRPEQPTLQRELIGRAALVQQILTDLQERRCVSLTGPGGVGKTSLGVAVSEQWNSSASFWFTLRPTFNDQIESLLFALGQFLHQQGAATLWQQLVADGGQPRDVSLALGLARRDLAELAYPPLLCFDELDFLRPLTPDQPNPKHVQILEFIDSLRGHTALLLIGQRAFWESDKNYAVAELSEPQLATLLAALAIPATAEDVARLQRYTGGNPRLVELCAALYGLTPHEPLQAVLDQLPHTPALLPLWHRLERRLPVGERRLLQALAVFRTPAPADAWTSADPATQGAFQQLVQRRLLQLDELGGVLLLPALRAVVYSELAVEDRQQYHLQAASIRAERGEYTVAAYHLHQADQPETAIDLWYTQRRGEINRGQASAALAIFAQISLRQVGEKTQRTLRLLRSELYQLLGEPEKVIETLSAATWPPQEESSVDAALLLGKALDQQGKAEQALRTYANGVTVATGLLSKVVQLHVQRSLTYLHERNLAPAWYEVNVARYLAENMLGTVQEQSGHLTAAHTHYTAALAIAQAANYPAGIAKSYHNLGNLAVRQRQIEQALAYYDQAMTSHQALGDQVGVEIARSGLAATYLQAAHYAEVIAPARQALHFFQAMGDSFWTALNASNLAEAYTDLGQWAEAEQYGQLVLEQEEPHSHPYALFTLGRVRQQQAEWTAAELYLSQARKVAELNGDRYLLAYAWETLGQIYQASGKPTAAHDAFTQSHQLFQDLQITHKAQELAQQLSFALHENRSRLPEQAA